jgi:hypothetical protein
MQNLQRKSWVYAIMVVWCVAATGLQFSTLQHLPIIQAPGKNRINVAEERYCQLPGVRNMLYLPELNPWFALTPATNYWMCKQVVRQHNRDFAVALVWTILPPALVLLALWFPPTFPSRRR